MDAEVKGLHSTTKSMVDCQRIKQWRRTGPMAHLVKEQIFPGTSLYEPPPSASFIYLLGVTSAQLAAGAISRDILLNNERS